jgi:hypothetical protein
MGKSDGSRWRKSSYSGANGGDCIEVGEGRHVILVRDTKDRTGPVLRFSPAGWRDLVSRVRSDAC